MAVESLAQSCCFHMFSQPWGLQINGKAVTVVPRVCCHHGEQSVLYNGFDEPGHGPFVAYESAAKSGLVTSQGLPPMPARR